jgi:hypothetical protein
MRRHHCDRVRRVWRGCQAPKHLRDDVSVNAGDWMSAMTTLKTLIAAACAPALVTSAFAQEAPPPKRVLQPDGATVQTNWVGCYDRKDYDRFETLRAREPETAGKFMLQMEMQDLCKNIDVGSRIFSEAFDDWSNRQCVRLSGEFYCLWTAITILW